MRTNTRYRTTILWMLAGTVAAQSSRRRAVTHPTTTTTTTTVRGEDDDAPKSHADAYADEEKRRCRWRITKRNNFFTTLHSFSRTTTRARDVVDPLSRTAWWVSSLFFSFKLDELGVRCDFDDKGGNEEKNTTTTTTKNNKNRSETSHTAQWRVYTDMGREKFLAGDVQYALKCFERALKEAKLGFGEKDAHVAAALNNLAELARTQRLWEKAEHLYKECLDLLVDLNASASSTAKICWRSAWTEL